MSYELPPPPDGSSDANLWPAQAEAFSTIIPEYLIDRLYILSNKLPIYRLMDPISGEETDCFQESWSGRITTYTLTRRVGDFDHLVLTASNPSRFDLLETLQLRRDQELGVWEAQLHGSRDTELSIVGDEWPLVEDEDLIVADAESDVLLKLANNKLIDATVQELTRPENLAQLPSDLRVRAFELTQDFTRKRVPHIIESALTAHRSPKNSAQRLGNRVLRKIVAKSTSAIDKIRTT